MILQSILSRKSIDFMIRHLVHLYAFSKDLILISQFQYHQIFLIHYDCVIMSPIASQITSPTTVYSTGYSRADQRKHQRSASLAFVWGIHRRLVNSPHKWPVTRKMFPFDDVIMISTYKAHFLEHDGVSTMQHKPKYSMYISAVDVCYVIWPTLHEVSCQNYWAMRSYHRLVCHAVKGLNIFLRR